MLDAYKYWIVAGPCILFSKDLASVIGLMWKNEQTNKETWECICSFIIKSLSSQSAFDVLMIATVCLVIDFLYLQPLIPSIYKIHQW